MSSNTLKKQCLFRQTNKGDLVTGEDLESLCSLVHILKPSHQYLVVEAQLLREAPQWMDNACPYKGQVIIPSSKWSPTANSAALDLSLQNCHKCLTFPTFLLCSHLGCFVTAALKPRIHLMLKWSHRYDLAAVIDGNVLAGWGARAAAPLTTSSPERGVGADK